MALLPDHYAGVRCMGDRAQGRLFLLDCFDLGYSNSRQKYKQNMNYTNTLMSFWHI